MTESGIFAGSGRLASWYDVERSGRTAGSRGAAHAVPAGTPSGAADTPSPSRPASRLRSAAGSQRRVRQKRQIAGQHQPREPPGARRAPSGCPRWALHPSTESTIIGPLGAGWDRRFGWRGPTRKHRATCRLASSKARSSWLLPAIGEHGFVAAHARARSAGQDQPVHGSCCAGACVGTVQARLLHGRSCSSRPPFASKRTSPMTMSCDSALHIS